MLRFGTDGVRGVALREITPLAVQLFARAAARTLHTAIFVVGYDTRESSAELAKAVADGLACENVEVLWAAMAPTPAIAFLGEHCDAAAAVITASHNPYTDNGLKFFGVGGLKLNDAEEAAIQNEYEALVAKNTEFVTSENSFTAIDLDAYVAHVCATASDIPAGLSLVVDCANGAMSVVAARVFSRLGLSVTLVNNQPDGRNINANCGAAHPNTLTQLVAQHGAQLGVAFDGDGDRLIAVDENGIVVDGDHLIAMSALDMHQRQQLSAQSVVVTVMTNIGFHRAMASAGIDVITTPVGDRSVLLALDAHGAQIGGEQSGHIIYRHLATTGDGLLAAIQLLGVLGRRGESLSQSASNAMTSMPQVLVNVALGPRPLKDNVSASEILRQFSDDIAAVEQELGGRGRVLVRASGTEPLIRVMVEADTENEAKAVAARLALIVSSSEKK